MRSRARHLVSRIRRRTRRVASRSARGRPSFVLDIVAADGSELERRLLEQGVALDEVILKYCWPRYALSAGAGISSVAKSENLIAQFERLVAMHRAAPSSIPMPLGTVRSPEGEFAGYVSEFVSGDTLETLISRNALTEARRQLATVEVVVAKLHRKKIAHGDINTSNIIAADDGRTLLIDPVARPSSGTELQDRICIEHIKQRIEHASLAHHD
jgi:hypothetical protein